MGIIGDGSHPKGTASLTSRLARVATSGDNHPVGPANRALLEQQLRRNSRPTPRMRGDFVTESPNDELKELVEKVASEGALRARELRALWDGLSDGFMTLLGLLVAAFSWAVFEIGPAAAATYLNWEKLYEIFSTRSVGALTWGEIATVFAVLILVLSAWRRLAKEHRDSETWRKVKDHIL